MKEGGQRQVFTEPAESGPLSLQGVLVITETSHAMSGQEETDISIKQEVQEEEDTDTSEKEEKNEGKKDEGER